MQKLQGFVQGHKWQKLHLDHIPISWYTKRVTEYDMLSLSLDMEKYPRGRRGSPAKGVVCDKRSPGSNPGFSALKNPCTVIGAGAFFYPDRPKQNALCSKNSLETQCVSYCFLYDASAVRCLRWFKSVNKVEKNMLMVAAASPATIRYQVAALRTFRKE